MSIRRLLSLCCLFLLPSAAFCQFPTDPRSDSIDIVRQSVDLRITDFTNKNIGGHTDIRFGSRTAGVRGIHLDLFHFTVDSVKIDGTPAPFTYNDTLLDIPFSATMGPNDSASVTVWYHGPAQQGSGGWGGFYWAQGIAFNMGVTLYDIPHNAGRFWFPCFDNFTEKAYFDVRITTQSTHTAVCGGTLLSQVSNPDLTKTWHWKLNRPVPSYLVSVAVGPFVSVHKTFAAANGPLPVILAALPSDTSAMKNSFQHLEQSFHIYEQFYGPYLWERVGYVLVPFNGGAMEHATNIAYQKTLVNGNLQYETVMAHELSHHWWGDLVTCETAEDMWINEGMAVFSEYLFLERAYNRAAALSSLRGNHNSVIRTAHLTDGGYQPLSGLPQAYTYGKHAYEKGADVMWSLRGYMGDSLFFKGLRAVLNGHRFGNVNAPRFRDILIDSTGYDAGPFFDDWMFQPGFAEFLLDSFTVAPAGGQFSVSVHTSQRLRAANHLYTQVPLEVTFVAPDRQQVTRTLVHSGAVSQGSFTVPFVPAAVFLNQAEKLAYAVTADEREIKNTGSVTLSYSNIRLVTATTPDSALVRTEYHWAKPDGAIAESWKYELTPDRFWKVDGIFPAGFQATATFAYDGTAAGPDYPVVYSGDSVALFYRKNSGDAWKPAQGYTTAPLQTNPLKGNLTVPLKKGEYCIGSRRITLSLDTPGVPAFRIYPNPSDGNVRIGFDGGTLPAGCRVTVYDVMGRPVWTGRPDPEGMLQTGNLPAGQYTLKLATDKKELGSRSLIIQR